MSLLEHLEIEHLWMAARLVFVAGLSSVAIGLGARSRALLESGIGVVAWSLAVVVANGSLVFAFGQGRHYSTGEPSFVVAALLGAVLVAFGAAWGALAWGWRPWSGVWTAAAVAACLPTFVVAWAHLDRMVVYPEPGIPLCMGMNLSMADAIWLGPLWLGVGLVAGIAATVAHGTASRMAERPLRIAADVALAGIALMLPFAAWRAATLPQPHEYAASVPVVGTASVDRPATIEETGIDVAKYETLVSRPFVPPGHYAFTGDVPPGLTLFQEGGHRGAWLSWRWSDGFALSTRNSFAADAVLSVRHDAEADLWLVSAGDEPLAALRSGAEWRAVEPLEGWALRNWPYVPWAEISHRMAPPHAWVVAAAIAGFLSVLLRLTRFESEESRRTLAAMRLALALGLCTPLAVAAARGFVFPF